MRAKTNIPVICPKCNTGMLCSAGKARCVNWECKKYAVEYNLAVTVYEEYDFLLVLTFNFGKKKLDQELMNIAIRKSDYLMDYDEESNELTGEIHFTSKSQSLRSEESGLLVKDILNLYNHISESLVGTIKTSQSPLSNLMPKR